MARIRERLGDPDYYQRPEPRDIEVGALPVVDPVEQAAPTPAEFGVPEPSGVVPDQAYEPAPAADPEPAGEAAFTMAKQPQVDKATGTEDTGWWANTGSGLMMRAGELLENLGTWGEKRVGEFDKALQTDPESGSLELDKMAARALTAGPRTMAAGLAAAATNKGLELKDEYGDYKVRGDWETVEDTWSKAMESADKLDVLDAAMQTGEFMLETGVVSLPDMFAMISAMPAYLGSRVEELAQDRAQNNNRDQPNLEDYAWGATTATIVTGIDKLSLGFSTKPMRELMEDGFAAAAKRIAKATGVEAAQEAAQESLEYAGTTVGTETDATLGEAGRRALAGAVGGAGFGAAVSTVAEGVQAAMPPATDPTAAPEPAGEAAVDDDYSPTDEEAGIGEEDFIPAPITEPSITTLEDEAKAAEAAVEAEVVEEVVEAEAEPEKPLTHEETINKAWAGLGLKKPQRAFVISKGLVPEDVTATGSAGSYTLGDLQRAADAKIDPAAKQEITEKLNASGITTVEQDAAKQAVSGNGEGTGGDIAAEGAEVVQAAAEAEAAAEEPAKVERKFTRGSKKLAEEAGLTDEELATAPVNGQGNITREGVESLIRVKNRADRGDVTKETEEILNFVDDNFPTGNYDTAKTGRTRQGKLGDKVSAVASLVSHAERLLKKSGAPQEVKARASELVANYKRIGKINDAQEKGKGFTSTIKAGVLDPLLDELSELITALDQNREAKEGTIQPATLEKLKEAATTVEEKQLEKTGKSNVTSTEIATTKTELANRRAELRKAKQGANRIRGAETRDEALKQIRAAEASLAADESNFNKQAGAVEKEAPKAEKRAKPGEKVKSGKSEVTAKKFTNAGEARNVMNKLGVPESVTGVDGQIKDMPIDVNHYSLMVGAYKKLRGEETDAAKKGDAKAEQAAKSKQRKLAATTKDIISTPDELAEGAHTRAAGALSALGLPKSAVDDVIDFAEASRRVVQREQKKAEDTTEEIREIAAEEDYGEADQTIDLEEQVGGQTGAVEGDLQEAYDQAVDTGDFAKAEQILAQMNQKGAKSKDSEADADKLAFAEDADSDTVLLSDEYDPNEDAAAYEGQYGVDYAKDGEGYFGDSLEFVDEYGRQIGFTHDKRKEAMSRIAARIIGVSPPKRTPGTEAARERYNTQMEKLGESIDPMMFEAVEDINDGADVINFFVKNLPKDNPLRPLFVRMSKMEPFVDFEFQATGNKPGRPTGYHNFGPAMNDTQTEWNGEKPVIRIDPVKFMRNPAKGVEIIAHEFVHHFTTMNTRLDNEAATYIDGLRVDTIEAIEQLGIVEGAELTRSLGGGELYGLSNVDEFLSEAFTNPDFQELLASLEVESVETFDGKKRPAKSIWAAFLDRIKSMLGLQTVPNTVLDAVLANTDAVFKPGKSAFTEGVIPPGTDMISESWFNSPERRRTRGGEEVLVRRSRRAGEDFLEIHRNLSEDVQNAAAGALGPNGAEWGKKAHEMMQGDDPVLVERLRDGSDEAVDSVAVSLAKKAKVPLSKAREWAGAMSLGLQTMDQILRNHGSKFSGKLDTYMDVLRDRNRIAARWQNRGAAIDEQWSTVEKAGNTKRFTEFVQEVTMSEVHPDYSWDKQKHLYNKREQKIKESQHSKVAAKYRSLSKAEKKLFHDMRKFFTAQRKELSRTALRHAARIHIEDEGLADEIYKAVLKAGSVEKAKADNPSLSAAFDAIPEEGLGTFDKIVQASKVRGAYFPLRRYGDWVVDYHKDVDLGTFDTRKEADAALREWAMEHPSNRPQGAKKKANGKFHALAREEGVEFFDSVEEANEYRKRVGADGWTTKESPTAKEDWGGRFDTGALQVLQQAKKKYRDDPRDSKAQKERNAALTAALDTAFLELLAETSIRKSNLQRKNIRGASLDGRRVFAERVFAGSYALADAETQYDQTEAMQDIWAEARMGGPQAYKQGQVARELTLRERHTVNDTRSNRFNDWVGSLGFLGFLAGPSYPIINATQPFMVGLPWLGARYGAKANGALFNNVAKLGPAVMKELVDSGMGLKRDPHQAVQNAINAIAKQGGGGAQMLRAMRDAGIMDSTFIDAVSEAAKGAGYNVSKSQLFKFAASAPKVVEVVNRSVMGATAYQLEMDKSGNHEKAVDVAKEAILQTQFDYSDFNKPRFFKHPGLRPFLLFKMYPQGIYGLLASSVRQMSNGSAAEKRQGFNTLLGLTASHTVMAGALGGIFMEPVRMLLSALEMLWPQDDDDKENFPFWDKQQFDINMRQVAADVLGDDHAAELLMRGIPRSIGLDLSGRLGLHNLMFMGMADDGTGKNMAHKMLDQLGGAPMSVITSWERAIQFAMNGNYKRAVETGAPKAIRDIMGARRAATEGMETFGGTRYANPSDFEPMDHWMKVMGFSAGKSAEMMEERWAQMSYDKRKTAKRMQLMNQIQNGATTFAEVNKTWNKANPDYRITHGDMLRKRQGQMRDEMLTSKGYPVNMKKRSIRREARF